MKKRFDILFLLTSSVGSHTTTKHRLFRKKKCFLPRCTLINHIWSWTTRYHFSGFQNFYVFCSRIQAELDACASTRIMTSPEKVIDCDIPSRSLLFAWIFQNLNILEISHLLLKSFHDLFVESVDILSIRTTSIFSWS